MLVYHITLVVAALICAASAGFIYAQAPDRRSSQLLAGILASGAWWAGCDLVWNLADSEAQALSWMRLTALGWLPLGALLPHLVLQSIEQSAPVASRPYRKLQACVAWGETAVSSIMVVVVWSTDWVFVSVFPTAWGWSFVPGPMLHVNYAIVTAGVIASCFVIWKTSRGASVAESLQLPWVWVGIVFPVVVIFATDVLMPTIGASAPRLGGASLAVTGLIVSWTVIHYGLSMLSPPHLDNEILETLEEGVALVSADGSILRANGALARISGYPPQDLVGMPMGTLLERDSGGGSGIDDLRRELTSARGEPIPVSVSTGILRERQHNELGVVVVVRDLRELEELRLSSMTNARLAAVGELAAGLAHEINNPVAFIGSNLRLLSGHWEKLAHGSAGSVDASRDALVDEGRELIAESLEGVERAADIVRGVTSFTHAGSSERTPALLEELVDDCLRMLRPQLDPKVRIVRNHPELPPVECSPQELKQVFLNLLVNALHAVHGSGTIEISTSVENDLALISFRDDGCGIEPEVLERIFDPFFTTKPVGEGTGLGLGIAHQVVARHGGSITVSSRLGEGTIFRVQLPLSPQKVD